MAVGTGGSRQKSGFGQPFPRADDRRPSRGAPLVWLASCSSRRAIPATSAPPPARCSRWASSVCPSRRRDSPTARRTARASGADALLDGARVLPTFAALEGVACAIGFTARPARIRRRVLTAREAGARAIGSFARRTPLGAGVRDRDVRTLQRDPRVHGGGDDPGESGGSPSLNLAAAVQVACLRAAATGGGVARPRFAPANERRGRGPARARRAHVDRDALPASADAAPVGCRGCDASSRAPDLRRGGEHPARRPRAHRWSDRAAR